MIIDKPTILKSFRTNDHKIRSVKPIFTMLDMWAEEFQIIYCKKIKGLGLRIH